MKVLFESYNFDAAANQITFNTNTSVELKDILIVTNVTTNNIIYNFADATRGGSISNNILTLTYDTSAMSNADQLQIFLDNTLTPASEESILYLKKIVQLLTPISIQDSAQRQRVSLDAAPATVTVTGTVSSTVSGTVTSNIGTGTLAAVTNLSQLGGIDARFQFQDAARLAYAQGIRKNLTF